MARHWDSYAAVTPLFSAVTRNSSASLSPQPCLSAYLFLRTSVSPDLCPCLCFILSLFACRSASLCVHGATRKQPESSHRFATEQQQQSPPSSQTAAREQPQSRHRASRRAAREQPERSHRASRGQTEQSQSRQSAAREQPWSSQRAARQEPESSQGAARDQPESSHSRERAARK